MEEKIRKNSEKKIDNPEFRLKIGTTNKFNPKVVYVEGKCFIIPERGGDDEFDKEIDCIRKRFKKSISKALRLSSIFDNKFILDFQIANTRMKISKPTYLYFQFMVQQSSNKPKTLKEIKDISQFMINDLAFSLENDFNSHYFLVSKTKPKTIYSK